MSSVSWYVFMSPCMLSLHLCFGRPLLRVPETSSLNNFAQMWFKRCRLKRWPNHFHDLFSWKVSMGVMCASFLMSSCLMWSYYRSFHVYQCLTSFSHMGDALVGRRTTAAGFHMQNMRDVWAKTLEYRSKCTHILNPTVGKTYVDSSDKLSYNKKKRQNELSREGACLFKVVDILFSA